MAQSGYFNSKVYPIIQAFVGDAVNVSYGHDTYSWDGRSPARDIEKVIKKTAKASGVELRYHQNDFCDTWDSGHVTLRFENVDTLTNEQVDEFAKLLHERTQALVTEETTRKVNDATRAAAVAFNALESKIAPNAHADRKIEALRLIISAPELGLTDHQRGKLLTTISQLQRGASLG